MAKMENRHYNIAFEPTQASNNFTGPFVIGYLFPDGEFGKCVPKYRVITSEALYRRIMANAKRTSEPWTYAYEYFRPVGAEKSGS